MKKLNEDVRALERMFAKKPPEREIEQAEKLTIAPHRGSFLVILENEYRVMAGQMSREMAEQLYGDLRAELDKD